MVCSAPPLKSDLSRRILTVVLAVPAVIWVISLEPVYWRALTFLLAYGAFREWSRLTLGATAHPMNFLCLACLALGFSPGLGLWSTLVFIVGHAIFYLSRENKNLDAAVTALGYAYLTSSFAILIHVFPFVGGSRFVLETLIMVWLVDTGAFLVGKTLRGAKLAPSISPNKTWSGFFGGIIVAALGMWLLGDRLNPARPNYFWAFVALALPLAQGGDLLESWCKRRFKAKDSGNFFPGHGGLLDRLDSLLAVGFVIALWRYSCE